MPGKSRCFRPDGRAGSSEPPSTRGFTKLTASPRTPQSRSGAAQSSNDDIVRLAASSAHQRNDVHLVITGDFGVKGKAYAQLTPEEWSEVRSISLERHRALN